MDGGVARTAGETWTINGGILTVRTDTRWHADAPASMTGVLGAVTISATLGGGVLLDARNVRWLAYDTGTGTVPAIGTNLTQGGVTSSYLLGVWASVNSAPTAVGAAMPASGFLKFREVDGVFAAGAITGIGANALGADVTGWIEVVQRQAVANTVPRLGSYVTRGDWFYLDDTTGVANQVLQVPTNGGGAGTHVPAVWIETGVGTGVYEPYTSLLAAVMIPANLSTDARSKFVCSIGTGQVRIGHNGTNACGYVPPAGCRVRIPNVLGRQATSAGGDANNQVPHATLATRPDFSTANAGLIDFEYFLNDWYHAFSNAYKVIVQHCATFESHNSQNEASPTVLNDYAIGSSGVAATTLAMTANTFGGTITDCKFFRAEASASAHACSLTTSSNLVFTRCHFGVVTYTRNTGRSVNTSQCTDLNFLDCYQYNSQTVHNTSKKITHIGLDHCDRFVGNTNTTTGLYVVSVVTSCDNIFVDGVTFGLKGVVTPDYTNPYLGVFYAVQSANVTFRNAGTRTTPLRVASTVLAPAYIYQDAGQNDNVRVQRCYLEQTRTSTVVTINTSKNQTFESLHGTVGAQAILSLNTLLKGSRATSHSTTGGASVYGSFAYDMFTSDTVGRLWLAMNEPTTENTSYITLTLAGAAGGFTSAGNAAMPSVGDELIMEFPYYVLGHTGFSGLSQITATNPQNFDYYYQIDPGTGVWSTEARLAAVRLRASGGTAGTNTFVFIGAASGLPQIGDYVWTDLGTQFTAGTTVTNVVGTTVTLSANILVTLTGVPIFFIDPALVAETISPSVGFKLRVRIETMVAATTNAQTYLGLFTTSTLADQTNNLYPLDLSTIVISGFTLGSRIQLYDVDNTTELYNGVPSSTTLTIAVPYTTDFTCRVRVMYATDTTAKMFVEFTEECGIDGFSRTVTQENDQVYIDNGIDGTAITDIVIDDGALLVEIDSGLLSWGYIYAYETYWLSTEEGIRDEQRFIQAIDTANYVFTDFKVKNVTSGPTVPLVITNGWGRDSVTGETIDIIDTTGGSIFSNPDLVIAYETTGGGGASAADVWSYSTRTLSTGGVTAVQAGLATSAEITALNDVSATDVWAATTRTLSTGGVTAVQAGLATSAEIAALNDLSAAEVNAEVDTALADYDAPTKTELDTAIGTVTTNQGVINVGVQKASKLIPHNTNL